LKEISGKIRLNLVAGGIAALVLGITSVAVLSNHEDNNIKGIIDSKKVFTMKKEGGGIPQIYPLTKSDGTEVYLYFEKSDLPPRNTLISVRVDKEKQICGKRYFPDSDDADNRICAVKAQGYTKP